MPSDRTRTAILEAAERLYADRGFADVTLRDIVAAADVNLAAVNYHFGSKDELIAELFVTRSLALNRERLSELRAAEDRGGGRADISEVLRALVGPSLRGCLGPDRQRSAAARFMIRASIESVPPIRKIKNREIDHLRRFAAAMKRSLPGRDEVELYWGLHFALAMAHQTIRDSERLTKLSEGKCDLDDVKGIVERVVSVAVMGVMSAKAKTKVVEDKQMGALPLPVQTNETLRRQKASVREIDDLVIGTTNAPYRRSIRSKQLVEALTSGQSGPWAVHVATFFTDVHPELVLRFAELHGIPKHTLASTYGKVKQATGEANPALEKLLGQLAPTA